jgi:hypothetical protein
MATMTAVAVRDLHSAMSNLQMEIGSQSSRARNDAQMGIKELQVLRLDVDMVTPPEVAEIAEPLVDAYRGSITTGDQLRLPKLTNLDGPSMRSAVNRVLSAKMTSIVGGAEALESEAKMRRVLGALEDTVAQIQRNAGIQHRG